MWQSDFYHTLRSDILQTHVSPDQNVFPKKELKKSFFFLTVKKREKK